jgi:hypothetical protein
MPVLCYRRYTILRPGGLGEGPPTGVIYANLDSKGKGGAGGSVHRSDLASFLLDSVEIHSKKTFPYLRKTPGLPSPILLRLLITVGISSILGTGWKKEKKKGFDQATRA